MVRVEQYRRRAGRYIGHRMIVPALITVAFPTPAMAGWLWQAAQLVAL